jgi:hypothetical protein
VKKETFTAQTIGSVIEPEILQTGAIEISLHDDIDSKRTDGVSA